MYEEHSSRQGNNNYLEYFGLKTSRKKRFIDLAVDVREI
jgi:hypothetical protein